MNIENVLKRLLTEEYKSNVKIICITCKTAKPEENYLLFDEFMHIFVKHVNQDKIHKKNRKTLQFLCYIIIVSFHNKGLKAIEIRKQSHAIMVTIWWKSNARENPCQIEILALGLWNHTSLKRSQDELSDSFVRSPYIT